ncbi:MAG: hypothetical protein L3J56_03885 [Bacteroidales bacterium]|nr:hypothetical protein [Bacteroidales bacterium]
MTVENLNNINNNNAFKVPENYFDNFSQEIETRIFEENIKKQFGNKNPFKVPENYFKDFKSDISAKPKSNFAKIIRITKPWLSAAAGIIIIFTLWQFLLTGIENKNNQTGNNDSLKSKNNIVIANYQPEINTVDIKYLEPEINAYIDETDADQIYEDVNEDNNETKINSDDETVYQYFIDYADDNDYTELLAEL